MQIGSHSWKFVGGEYFNESVPYGIRYADFMFKLSEKFRTAVSVKYHAPGEELVPDQLISVQDDADLQVCRTTQGFVCQGMASLAVWITIPRGVLQPGVAGLVHS